MQLEPCMCVSWGHVGSRVWDRSSQNGGNWKSHWIPTVNIGKRNGRVEREMVHVHCPILKKSVVMLFTGCILYECGGCCVSFTFWLMLFCFSFSLFAYLVCVCVCVGRACQETKSPVNVLLHSDATSFHVQWGVEGRSFVAHGEWPQPHTSWGGWGGGGRGGEGRGGGRGGGRLDWLRKGVFAFVVYMASVYLWG